MRISGNWPRFGGAKLRFFLFSLFCVAVCLGLLTGCARDSDTVTIGWLGPLTGDMAVWGISESSATRMFFDQLNEQGGLLGKQVRLVAHDTRGEAMETINVTRRLATMDNAIGIIGPNTSGQALAMVSALNDVEVASIATVATNPRVTVAEDGSVNPFNFRVAFIDNYQGPVAAGFAFNHLNARTAAVLFDVGSDYSHGVSEFFQEHFRRLGGNIVAVEGFNPRDVDFRPQLTSIRNANPDVILMPFSFREVALATQQARDLGITSIFLGTDTWPSALLLEMAADSIAGSYIVHHMDLRATHAAWLRDMYFARFNREPEINAFLAWDASTMLVEAVQRANSFDPVAIRNELVNTDFMGITGRIRIGANSHNPEGKTAAILTVIDGEFVFVQNYSPTF